jgi:Uma2 family endonuclease
MSSAHELDASIRPLRRSEYDKLIDEGFFEGEPIELLWGCLVRMDPQKSRHAAAVQYLTELFVLAVVPSKRATVRIQSLFAATDDSEPEPDVAVVPVGTYRDAHPSEALLVVEVAERSLRADRAKAALYAAAGVPEYWIVNLTNDTVEVHRDPVPKDQRYAHVTTHARGEAISAVVLPSCTLRLTDLFDPA